MYHRISAGGSWWADTPQDMWPTEEAEVQAIRSNFQDEEIGDRRLVLQKPLSLSQTLLVLMNMCMPCRQEIVLIGTNLDKARVRAQLDGCLLSDEELAAGPEQWAELDDPFPESHSHDHEHEHEHDENCDHDHSHIEIL